MKKVLVLLFMAAAWVGGYGYGRWYAKPLQGKKPLYYIDPMHPWYKSDVPGIAPDGSLADGPARGRDASSLGICRDVRLDSTHI